MTPISSAHNPRIRQIRALHSRKEREASGLFYIDGAQLVAAALEHGAGIELLVAAPDLLRSPLARELAHRLRADVACVEVTAELFHLLAGREDVQGLGAVVRQRWTPLERLAPAGRCLVALDSVQYPGNLGTILRTSEAAGGAGLVLLGRTADPYDPTAVRASTGAIFAQRLARATPAALGAWALRNGALVVGTSPAARLDYREAHYRAPLVLAMGGEAHGLSDEARAVCDTLVRIPMVGAADSLNLAVATGLMLYEAYRQRAPVEARSRLEAAGRA